MNNANVKFVISMLIFGSNGLFVSFIPWSSYEVVLARTIIGAFTMLGILLLKKQKFVFLEHKGALNMLILSGIFLGIIWIFLYEAFTQLGVGLAQILTSCGPAIAMMLAPIIFKEKVLRHKVIGFLIVVMGMVLISSTNLGSGKFFGLICGIIASLAYAGFLICNRLARDIKGPERTMWQLFVAALLALSFCIYQNTGLPTDFSFEVIIAVIVLGVVNTGLAMNLMFSVLPQVPMQNVAIYAFLEPMSALMLSVMFLGERLGLIQIMGVSLILAGTGFSELYSIRRGKKLIKNSGYM